MSEKKEEKPVTREEAAEILWDAFNFNPFPFMGWSISETPTNHCMGESK